MTNDSIEPNEIADSYQAFSEYHTLLSRLVTAREEISGETSSTLHALRDLISEKRAEFGEATATRNPFTMDEYREVFGDELPTIRTDGLTREEREPLEWLGIVTPDETFRIPCDPLVGERLPLWPQDERLAVDYNVLQEFVVPQPPMTLFHISDTHLGYRHRMESDGNAETKWVHRTDSLAAFKAVLRLAIVEDVDAVIHTGDLFDNDVNENTLQEVVTMIERLADNGIPFCFILGDHDRSATGGEFPSAVDAIRTLQVLVESRTATYCTTAGCQPAGLPLTVFGVDATGVGFEKIERGYTLKNWSIADLSFGTPATTNTNVLCLHEPIDGLPLSDVIRASVQEGWPLDLVLLGHEHRPPFGEEWQTTIDGVPVACAGPTIPISSHFVDHLPGYNRIRIGSNGNLGVHRRELPQGVSG